MPPTSTPQNTNIPHPVMTYFQDKEESFFVYQENNINTYYEKKDGSIQKLEQERELGRGSYGVVYRMKNTSGESRAMKIINASNPEILEQTIAEAQVAYYMGLVLHEPYEIKRNNQTYIHLNMQLLPGHDMDSYIQDRMHDTQKNTSQNSIDKSKYLPENSKSLLNEEFIWSSKNAKSSTFPPISKLQFLNMYLMMINQLNYAHSMGIAHRDIKPANIQIDPFSGTASLLDWGLFYDAGSKENLEKGIVGEVFGTPAYLKENIGDDLHDVEFGYEFNKNAVLSDKTDSYMLAQSMAELFYACNFKDEPGEPSNEDIEQFLKKAISRNPKDIPHLDTQRESLSKMTLKTYLKTPSAKPKSWKKHFKKSTPDEIENSAYAFTESALQLLSVLQKNHSLGIYHGKLSAESLHLDPKNPGQSFIDGYSEFLHMTHNQHLDLEIFGNDLTPNQETDLHNYVGAILNLMDEYAIRNPALKNALIHLNDHPEEITPKNLKEALEEHKVFVLAPQTPQPWLVRAALNRTTATGDQKPKPPGV